MNDYFDNSWNKCGIYSLELTLDNEVLYVHQLDKFSFDESRYINAHIVYDEYLQSKNRYQKTWIDPGNQLSTIIYQQNNGIVTISDEQIYQVKLLVKDAFGNSSEISFQLKGNKTAGFQPEQAIDVFKWNENNSFRTDNFRLNVPTGNLYNNLYFNYKTEPGLTNFFVDIN